MHASLCRYEGICTNIKAYASIYVYIYAYMFLCMYMCIGLYLPVLDTRRDELIAALERREYQVGGRDVHRCIDITARIERCMVTHENMHIYLYKL